MNSNSPSHKKNPDAAPPPSGEELSHSPTAKTYALMARYGITPIEVLASDKEVGTSVHLGERREQRIVSKILTHGKNEEMGREALAREQMALEANLKGLPQMVEVLCGIEGTVEGISRVYCPGSPVITQVALGNLSPNDFEKALRELLRSYEEKGFYLQDTDASNFIIAAEFGIVNPAAVHRTLMLIDPEALTHSSCGIRVGDMEDSVNAVMMSLHPHIEAAKR